MSRSAFSDRMALLVAGLLFSTGGAVIKASSFDGPAIAGGRSLIAACVILITVPASRRGWSWRVAGAGLAYAATLTLYATANKLTTAANAIFLQATAPVWVLLLAPLLLRERARARDVGVLLLLAAGMALFFVGSNAPSRTAPDPAAGDVLATASGLTWAATVMSLRALARGPGGSGAGAAAAVIGNLIAFAGNAPFADLTTLRAGSLGDWAALLWLGGFQVGAAYVLVTRSLRAVPAFAATALLMIEPVLNPVWAWLAHGEVPPPLSFVGGTIVILTVLLHAWLERPGAAAAETR